MESGGQGVPGRHRAQQRRRVKVLSVCAQGAVGVLDQQKCGSHAGEGSEIGLERGGQSGTPQGIAVNSRLKCSIKICSSPNDLE